MNNVPYEVKPNRKDNSGLISLVLGILSIVCGLTGTMLVGTILGIIGIVQGSKNRRIDSEAQAGFICSIIGTVLSSIIVVIAVILFASFGSLLQCMFLPMLFW